MEPETSHLGTKIKLKSYSFRKTELSHENDSAYLENKSNSCRYGYRGFLGFEHLARQSVMAN